MKRKILISAAILVFIPIVLITPKAIFWLAESDKPQVIGKSVSRITTDQKIISLTFDDGPNPPCTDSILNVLKRNNVKASFFVVGKYAQAFPWTVQRVINNGHLIGNHSWSHKNLILKTPWHVAREIDKTDSIIRNCGYIGDIFFRSPRGLKLLVLPYILAKKSRYNILFDAVAEDWEDIPIERMVKNVCDHVRPGSIILLHDGDGDKVKADRSATVRLTEIIIDTLIKQGFRFVTIPELLNASGQ